MPRGKVYITQDVLKRDKETGIMMPTMDFRKALEYGDLEVCLPEGRLGLVPGPTIQMLKAKLRDFCDDDYIVAVGDPSVVAMVGAICSEVNMGRFKMLKWDRDSKQYISVSIDLFNRRKGNSDES